MYTKRHWRFLVNAQANQASAFANSRNIRIGSLRISTNVKDTLSLSPLDVFYQRVAPYAINNEGGRADRPRCHPGTREEVIRHIEKWADDPESERIMWMSGPVGGGKTAIMKTVMERRAIRDAGTAAFFFFRADLTRGSARPVVPTLLYQLQRLYPSSSETIIHESSQHPLILDGGFIEQCTLITALIPSIREYLPPGQSIVLLIDGLDECDIDAEQAQPEILHALAGLVALAESPFRLLVSSRPEAHIKMAFNKLSMKVRALFLDEEYRPDDDIRRYVDSEFASIKATHPLAYSLPAYWPDPEDVGDIVRKSSGQFNYAATVMRYLAQAHDVPSLSLARVKGIQVPPANNSPFTSLDSIYTFILEQVGDDEAVRDILAVRNHITYCLFPSSVFQCLKHLNDRYTEDLVASCISRLASILRFTSQAGLEFYHASLPDFLRDHQRSGKFWTERWSFNESVLVALWHKPPIDGDNVQMEILSTTLTPRIVDMLFHQKFPEWTRAGYPPGLEFLLSIKELHSKNPAAYQRIMLRFIPFAMSARHIPEDYTTFAEEDMPQVQRYMELYSRHRALFWIQVALSRVRKR